jgi:hypothetical protein
MYNDTQWKKQLMAMNGNLHHYVDTNLKNQTPNKYDIKVT